MLVPVVVREVMEPNVETVAAGDAAREVSRRLHERDAEAVVVLRDGHPAGIVTEGDLIGLVAEGADIDAVPVEQFMSAPLVTVPASASVERAATKLREHRIRHLPVVEDGRLVGLLSVTDLSYYIPQAVLELPSLAGTTSEEDWEYEYRDEAATGLSVGDVVQFSKQLTDRDVRSFAKLSGDTNPLHLEESFADGTRFNHRIVHGALAASLISAALARLPGLTIYLSQDLRFVGPVEIGETPTAVVEVIDDLGHGRYRLATRVYDTDDELVIDGEAVVLVDELPTEAADAEAA